MPLDDTGSWVVTPLGERITALQTVLTEGLANLGLPAPSFAGTIEGGWVDLAASLAVTLDEGGASLFAALSPETAPRVALVALAERAGVTVQQPTKSRWTVRSTASGASVVYPAGYLLRDPATNDLWSVVASTTITATETQIVIEADQAGPKSITTGTTLTKITGLSGVTSPSYDSSDGDPVSIGRNGDSVASLRAKIRAARAALPGPTGPGLRQALLAVPWVTAIALAKNSAANITITVVPDPVGADQIAELAETVLNNAAFGTQYTGSNSTTITVPGGGTETIRWASGSTRAVDVAVTVARTSASVDATQLEADVTAAIEASFSVLSVGQSYLYGSAYCGAFETEGAQTVTALTIDGGTSDVVALSTELLVAGTITVTVT